MSAGWLLPIQKDLKAVFFDMDGVLFDSMPAHARCWVEMARTYALDVSLADVYRNEGRTGADSIDLFALRSWGRTATPQEQAECYAEKCRLFNQCPEAPIMPGADAVLRKVHDSGRQIFVVTGSGQDTLLQRLQSHFSVPFTRRQIVSAADCQHGKPHPEPYLLALQKSGVSTGEAVVVENAPLGIQAAKAAGLFTIGVNTGPLPDADLLEAGADVVLPSMSALAQALDL